jgi:hypothetical protein
MLGVVLTNEAADTLKKYTGEMLHKCMHAPPMSWVLAPLLLVHPWVKMAICELRC